MRKDQGIAPIIIVIIVAVVAIGGYFFLQKSGKAPGLPLPSMVSLNPNCKFNDPDLCKYVNRTIGADYFGKSMAIKGTTKDKSGKAVSEMMMESEGQDKSHVVVSQDGKEITNTITIGKTTYIKDSKDGKWWKQTVEEPKTPDAQKAESTFDPKKLKDEFSQKEDKTTFKKIGKESCGSLTCFKYQIVNPDSTDVTEYVYFDDQEYILRKMVTVTKDGETSETTFEFGTAKVSEPSPTKDVPKGENIYMMGVPGAGMMNQQNNSQMKEQQNKMMQEIQKSNTQYKAPAEAPPDQPTEGQ